MLHAGVACDERAECDVLLYDHYRILSSASANLPCKAGRETKGEEVHAQELQRTVVQGKSTCRYGGSAFSEALTMVFWCRDAIGRLGSGSTIPSTDDFLGLPNYLH